MRFGEEEYGMEVKFYESVDDSLLKFAVIISRSSGKWVFCKHRERATYEIPGGHRESGETLLEAAKRELREETGAIDFCIEPLCVYSVTGKNRGRYVFILSQEKTGSMRAEKRHTGCFFMQR